MDPFDEMTKVAKQFTLEDIFGKPKKEIKFDVDKKSLINVIAHTDTHNRIVERNEALSVQKKAFELEKKKHKSREDGLPKMRMDRIDRKSPPKKKEKKEKAIQMKTSMRKKEKRMN